MTGPPDTSPRGTAPESIIAGFDRLCTAFSEQSHIPPRVLERCRLRLMQLHGCTAQAVIVEPATAACSGRAQGEEDQVRAGEQACIAFTEVYAMDVQAITDEHADAVKAEFGDAGLVTLIEALGIFDGLIRLDLAWRESA